MELLDKYIKGSTSFSFEYLLKKRILVFEEPLLIFSFSSLEPSLLSKGFKENKK